MRGSIALKGGRIDDLILADYRETIKKNSPPITLLSPSGTAEPYFADFGWAGGQDAPGLPRRPGAVSGATRGGAYDGLPAPRRHPRSIRVGTSSERRQAVR